MKAETHLTSLDKKVLTYMLENNLTHASTARKKYTLKSLQNDGNNLIEKVTLSSAIIEANERITFLQSNDYKESYMFNKQLVII